MPELGTQLRDYLEAAAPPITEEEVRLHPLIQVPTAILTVAPRRRRRLVPAMLTALLVLVALVTAGLLLTRAPEAPVIGPSPDGWQGLWPQTSRGDAERAQVLADAGEPAYAWQAPGADPGNDYPARMEAIPVRFLQEHLGWREGRVIGVNSLPRVGVEQDWEADVLEWYVIRCGEGVNQLYPNDPVGSTCPPTIDATHYEVGRVDTAQLVRRGRDGIWLVTGWQNVTGTPEAEGGVQADPPTEAEVRNVMEAFLDARLAGRGAEGFIGFLGQWNDPVELGMYATNGGSPFVGYEITSISGPEWPSGTFSLAIRLIARDETVVQEGTYFASPEDFRAGRFTSHFFEVSEIPPGDNE